MSNALADSALRTVLLAPAPRYNTLPGRVLWSGGHVFKVLKLVFNTSSLCSSHTLHVTNQFSEYK